VVLLWRISMQSCVLQGTYCMKRQTVDTFMESLPSWNDTSPGTRS
jgi:hypothetical protein